ncbi:MAG: PatB family C-S lyase [Verrucomicrobiota bacterium]
METFDFETPLSRLNTGSLKWEKYKDRDILPLWVADMDFKSPQKVLDALYKRVDHGIFGYTKPYDSVEAAVINYLADSHGFRVERSSLVWLPGLVPALNVAARACGQPQDAVMTSTPVYPPFLTSPTNQLKTLVTDSLKYVDGRYTFDFDAMERSITPETRMFILCNPHNPVGRVFSRDELIRLADFCTQHGLWLVSDEIHCDLLLNEDVKHVAMGTLDHPIREKLISLFAPSKTYNLPGLACSIAVIEDPKTRLAFQRAARGMITEVNCFGYAGCEAAYSYGEPWRQALLKTLRKNRDTLYSALETQEDKVTLRPMEATYLAWMDMTSLKNVDLATHFENHGIGLSDGSFFGTPGFLRLNFGCPEKTLIQGIERLLNGLAAL